jgi:pyridoxamine 5'-phosphate oxidase
MLPDLEKLREEYAEHTLDASDADPDPFRQLEHWLSHAVEAGLPEPNAMTLATCTPDGKPSARVVLLKGIEGGGLDFYTNYESRKGRELEENPRAAVVFLWLELQRQLRVEGRVERVPEEQSSRYFQSRPIGSQIGAAASPQSRIMNDRAELERNFAELEKQYNESGHIPRPPHWGGYRIIPDCFEFWQGRRSRLHDRLQYALDEEGRWRLERLAP